MCGKRAFTLVELLLALCIILVLAGMFTAYSRITLKAAQETALINELHNIRMAIEFYRISTGSLPQDLAALTTTKGLTEERLGGIRIVNKYLKGFKFDKEGYVLDPFLKRYRYDNQSGKVSPATHGYEDW